jgi:subtilisin family serine protease
MIQMKSTPTVAVTAFGPAPTVPDIGLPAVAGVRIDAAYSPVPIPPPLAAPHPTAAAPSAAFGFEAGATPTYVVRAEVESPDAMAQLQEVAMASETVVGVFADPKIEPIATCPWGPVGTDQTVEQLLHVGNLQGRGMNGAGVRVVIVDSGVNLDYLNSQGKTPAFDQSLSWSPSGTQPVGDMPIGHGTMCAYDVCIAAPRCTLIDHALLTSTTTGGSAMEGLLSDAVLSYGLMLSWMVRTVGPFAGDTMPHTLVVNNSWGMFHPSWDFPVGDPANYSDNPAHPFNIIVSSLESAGADILFAAGNCGAECPDGRCQNLTNAGIFGANSSPAVLSVAGAVTTGERIGYSTQGPGRLTSEKPDITCYTHFAGSGVYAADGGTSAATPVAAGVVAAIRRLYPSSVLPPTDLRQHIRDTAAQPGSGSGHNNDYGFGIIDVEKLLDSLPAI